jgi:hypothetical protein
MKSCFLRPIPPNFEQTYLLTVYEIFKNLKPAHHIPASRQHETLSRLAHYISVLVQVERADSPSPSPLHGEEQHTERGRKSIGF